MLIYRAEQYYQDRREMEMDSHNFRLIFDDTLCFFGFCSAYQRLELCLICLCSLSNKQDGQFWGLNMYLELESI